MAKVNLNTASVETAPAAPASVEVVDRHKMVVDGIKACPLPGMAVNFLEKGIAAGKIDFQQLAAKVYPTVNDLRISGWHISTSPKLRGYVPVEQADEFEQHTEILVNLVRMQPTEFYTPGPVLFGMSSLIYPAGSSKIVLVGEHLDVGAMVEATKDQRILVLGKRNPEYSPNAKEGDKGYKEWFAMPITRASAEPKVIRSSLGEQEAAFSNAAELIEFLANAKKGKKESAPTVSNTDLMAMFGLE